MVPQPPGNVAPRLQTHSHINHGGRDDETVGDCCSGNDGDGGAAFRAGKRSGRIGCAGYITGMGSFTTSGGNTTGDFLLEGGVRVLPHVMVIGNVGRLGNLQSDLQPTLDATTTALANNQGLSIMGAGSLPATYVTGGLRLEVPANHHILPYMLGTMGVAHFNPSPTFTFASGVMPGNGSVTVVGTDVTSALESTANFTLPATSNAFIFTLGGGVQLPVIPHWIVDAGYRYSRVAADSTLSASALNANTVTFGFGYRF